ncbi:hypothetical protein GCM10027074_54200 [Streptomyces deserti]
MTGVGASSIFATSTMLTSTGAVDSFHSSFTGLGGGITLLGMMLGEIAPGSLLVGAIVIITGLTYFPALALGPLAEGLAA